MEKAGCESNVGELAAKFGERTIDIKFVFPECVLKLPVQHWRQEVQLRVAALVKERGVGARDSITPMEWEKVCLPMPDASVAVKLGDGVLKGFRAAREAATRLLDPIVHPSLKDILALFMEKRTLLVELDKTFDIEINLLKWLNEKGLHDIMMVRLLECMPSSSKEMNIEESLAAVAALQGSDLHKYLNLAERAEMQACKDMLEELKRGMSPKGANDETSKLRLFVQRFAQSVACKFQNWLPQKGGG